MSFPLVTICVLQVDDINGDKNVSSAQIVGECFRKRHAAESSSLTIPLSMAMTFTQGPCPFSNRMHLTQNSGLLALKHKMFLLAPIFQLCV